MMVNSETAEDGAIYAMNIALAHVEGRRDIFSTRDPMTVAAILRKELGERVNEDRGKGFQGGVYVG